MKETQETPVDSATAGTPGDRETDERSNIQSPHDAVFREFWSDKEVVASFIREYVPANITRLLDFNSLKISKDSFIDKELDRYFSDMLYEIKYKGKRLLLYFLFEHKSVEERFTGFQLLKYMVKIWEQYLKQHKKARHLPVIVPLVVYHGKKKWSLDTRFSYLFEDTAGLESYVPDFSYDIYDISHLPDDGIKGDTLLKIVLKTFKHSFDPHLQERLGDIFRLFDELSDKTKADEYLEVLLRYLIDSRDLPAEKLQQTLTEGYKEGGKIMPTLGERWRQEGRLEGKLDVVRNSLSKGFSIDDIADITGLPIKKIKQMKAKIERESLPSMPPETPPSPAGGPEQRAGS